MIKTDYEWASNAAPFTTELSNSCTCMRCDTCETHTGDFDECGECGNATIAAEWCDNTCWELIKDDLADNIFPEWLTRNGSPEYIRIHGRRMGWTNAEGSAVISAEFQDLLNALTINGDWNLRFTLSGDEFTIQRYSHDEPTGASFILSPSAGDDAE